MSNQIEIPDDFNVPFPPDITAEEVLSRRTHKKLGSRPPNCFFIYRLTYLKALKNRLNINNFSMIDISPHIGSAWSRESVEVKRAYKKISDDVETRLEGIRLQNFVVINEDPRPRVSTPTA